MNCKYLCVSGYGWSGSGLYIDVLKEMNEFSSLNFEFSLIKEPNGVLDLDYAITENWDVLRAHFAMAEFRSYCRILNRRNSKFGMWGLDIGSNLGVNFEELTDEFLSDIAEFSYKGNTRILRYSLNHIQSIMQKVSRRLMPKKFGSQEMFFAKLENEEFIKIVRNYLNKLFAQSFRNNHVKCLILDQAIPTSNSCRALEYLDSSKLIIVDRDPRDIYVDLIKNNVLLGSEAPGIERAKKYVSWHLGLRANKPAESRDVLHLNFEDIIMNRCATLTKLINFLNLPSDAFNHNSFDSSQSFKNTGMWRLSPFMDEIKFIEENLMEFET
jgi:hypothetical protein